MHEVLELGSGGGHNAVHLTAGFTPDAIEERFCPRATTVATDAPDGRGVRYLAWVSAPDPDDTLGLTEHAFLLWDVQRSIEVLQDTHRLGLFGLQDWRRLLGDAGLEASAVTETTSENRPPREFVVGHRRAGRK